MLFLRKMNTELYKGKRGLYCIMSMSHNLFYCKAEPQNYESIPAVCTEYHSRLSFHLYREWPLGAVCPVYLLERAQHSGLTRETAVAPPTRRFSEGRQRPDNRPWRICTGYNRTVFRLSIVDSASFGVFKLFAICWSVLRIRCHIIVSARLVPLANIENTEQRRTNDDTTLHD
jgi:hypothetical protein